MSDNDVADFASYVDLNEVEMFPSLFDRRGGTVSCGVEFAELPHPETRLTLSPFAPNPNPRHVVLDRRRNDGQAGAEVSRRVCRPETLSQRVSRCFPPRRAEFLAEVQTLVNESNKEPGMVVYTLTQQAEGPKALDKRPEPLKFAMVEQVGEMAFVDGWD